VNSESGCVGWGLPRRFLSGGLKPTLRAVSLTLWVLIILLPLSILFVHAISSAGEFEMPERILSSVFRSFALAAGIGAAAVVLGWVPGRLLGTSRTHKDVLLFLLLMPLVLPRYVLYYAWSLLLSPTTQLGGYLSSRPSCGIGLWPLLSSPRDGAVSAVECGIVLRWMPMRRKSSGE